MRTEYIELDIEVIDFGESEDIIVTSNCLEEFKPYPIIQD